MDAETRPTRLRIGPDSVYAAYVVAGVTYTHAAPTVSLMPFNALELAMLEIDAETLVAGNNSVVPTPARDVRFVAERGWVDFTAPAEVVRERDPASPAEFAYRVFDALGADGVAFASRGGWLALDFAAPTNTVVRKARVSRPRRARALCGV